MPTASTVSSRSSTSNIACTSECAPSSVSSTSTYSRIQHRKRRRSQNDGGDDSDEEEYPPKTRSRGAKTGVDSTQKKFACPFMKHDPRRCQWSRSCAGPGWDTTHRVKQHLQRVHAPRVRCPRCGDAMVSDVVLNSHVRQKTPCLVKEIPVLDDMTHEQAEQLRRRAPKHAATEKEKWFHIFGILFPDVKTSDRPSPCEFV
jgi:predicted RNA-binding Zn-ribbon protein involved in translation (DUF1610 family)